jgi:hypothetical protein
MSPVEHAVEMRDGGVLSIGEAPLFQLKPCATRGNEAAENSSLHIYKRLLVMHLPRVYVRA